MYKTVLKVLIFILGLSTSNMYCQDFSTLWQAHYSYNDIVDVVSGSDKIYAAAQNAVFEYDILSGELKTITTVEGLSGEQITTIHYSEIYQYLLIGYETGLIEVYLETDESVLSVVDILEKENMESIDFLKIDKSFIDDVQTNDNAEVIIRTITSMAKNLNLKTVAEGVETEEQFSLLKKLGCDYFQGYLFGRPGDLHTIKDDRQP